jgi:Tol biopolymer transport system component
MKADTADFCKDEGTSGNGRINVFVKDDQVFVDEGNDQPARPIARLAESRITNPVTVSPMGDLVAYSDQRPGLLPPVCSDQVFVVNIQTGDVKQVSDFYDYGIGTLIFSPDGKKIAFSAVKCAIGGFGGSHVGIVEVDGSVKEFRDFDSSHSIVSKSLFFSPDGSLFGFLVNASEDSAVIHIYSLTR